MVSGFGRGQATGKIGQQMTHSKSWEHPGAGFFEMSRTCENLGVWSELHMSWTELAGSVNDRTRGRQRKQCHAPGAGGVGSAACMLHATHCSVIQVCGCVPKIQRGKNITILLHTAFDAFAIIAGTAAMSPQQSVLCVCEQPLGLFAHRLTGNPTEALKVGR